MSEDLRITFLADRQESIARSISVDVRPLDSMVQRTIARTILMNKGNSFGLTHIVPIDALTLGDLARYYIDKTAEKYGEVRESYDPKSRVTTRELRISKPEELGEFCSFETFMPEHKGFKSIRISGGRKSDTDMLVAAVIKLRNMDIKHTPGCVQFGESDARARAP